MNPAEAEHTDPVVESFLAFLGSDAAKNPERLTTFPPALLARAREIAAQEIIDHDATLDGAIEL